MTIDYATLDNVQLLALSTDGDDDATAELADRGNTVVDSTTLAKTIKGSDLIGYTTINPDDVVVINNGKVVQVNGNPYP